MDLTQQDEILQKIYYETSLQKTVIVFIGALWTVLLIGILVALRGIREAIEAHRDGKSS